MENYHPSLQINKNEKKNRESSRYSWVNGDLFYTSYDSIIIKCAREYEILEIFKECHDEPCGGHFANKQTPTRCCNWAIIGQQYSKIPKPMSKGVRVSKE